MIQSIFVYTFQFPFMIMRYQCDMQLIEKKKKEHKNCHS